MSECPLCGRPLGTENIDRHHLVPKSRKGRVQEPIHKICHRKIHATFTEKQLEKTYHTWESLRAEPAISEFVTWVQKKEPGYYDTSDDKNTKRKRR